MTGAIRVRVPASSANLGPGFDCLGLALGLYHELDVVPASGRAGVGLRVDLTLSGQGARDLPRGDDNLLVQTLRAALSEHGYRGPDLTVRSRNQIPLARGLGSSAAAYLAGRAAGERLATGTLDRDRLLQQGRAVEGHADNIAPSVFGGVTVVAVEGTPVSGAEAGAGRVAWLRLEPPPGLRALLAVPDFELATSRARAALPCQVPRADAVHGLSRACLLTAAIAAGRLEVLRLAMADERLHESYREALVPGLRQVCAGALAAGAWGAALSGAGPSVLALASAAGAPAVAQAMHGAWRGAGIDCEVLTLLPDTDGLQVQALDRDETDGSATPSRQESPKSP